ncbi:MAG: hypothetical protein Q8R96_02510 [Bacteroidota bacterium]|nr:hypothetical protein [Bacteroidota bacterium]
MQYSVSNYLGLEDGKVNRSYGNISLGVGIRAVKGDQIGYGFTQELTPESMLSAAATASTLCNMNAAPVATSFNKLKTGNVYASVVAERNGKREQSFYNMGGHRDFSFYTDEVVNKVSTKAVNMR